ncbi:MAG: hypothetical protein K1000chlam2_00474 [Chlamydiae bacterium]|nr:hypothetical protein [Chlamydiota bacterium]
MLGFFRKYQKFFFVIVTFFIVISFSFFGAFGAIMKGDKVVDREIGQLVDGSVLKEQRLHGLIRLLQHGIEEGGRTANLLNDSVIHKDILLSGIGEMLAEHLIEKLESELEEKWKRVKNYAPYTHPYALAISAQNVWAQFCPEINTLLEEVKQAPEEFSKAQLALLFKLYHAQAQFPPPLLHQMLYYQQQQNEQVRPDPGLPQANVALFGFQSVEDWFGAKFVEEIGKFILNAACIAKEEGYKVTKGEAHVSLLSNVYRGIKVFMPNGNPSEEDAHKHFSSQLSHIGLDEAVAVDHWRDVLHFCRFFHEVGESVFLDSLALDQFKRFAKPSNRVCRYRLPHALQLSSFDEMLKFQCYLEITHDGDYLGLPTQMRAVEEIMDVYPQLAYKPFKVEIATVSKGDVAARISLKETWRWEAHAEHFVQLQGLFPALSQNVGNTLEERMAALENLDEFTRFKVDQFARNALVDENPLLVDELLMEANFKGRTLSVRLKDEENTLSGAHFLGLLENEDPSLARYSTDGETFYSIRVLEKGKGWHLVSFDEINRTGEMEEILDVLLTTAYPSLGFEEPFDEVKEEVGAKVYADLLQAIGTYAKIDELDDYAHHRFDGVLHAMRDELSKNPEGFVQEGPWALDKREEQLAQNRLHLEIGEFSPVEKGGFYQLLDQEEVSASLEEIANAKEHLKRDAKRELMTKILKRL